MNSLRLTAVILAASAGLSAAFLTVPALAVEAGDKDDGQKLKAGDRDPEFLSRVNECIRKGREYILSEQKPEGFWPYTHAKDNYDSGSTALALLALLKSGQGRFDDCIERGFRWLRTQPFTRTYSTALTIMAIEARWSDHKVEDQIRQDVSQLVKNKPKVPKNDLSWIEEAVRFLLEHVEYSQRITENGTMITERDAWSYPNTPGQDAPDHSNTQFALLGLKSASRCGVKVPADPFVKALKHFLKFQEKDGPKVGRVVIIEDKQHGYVSYKPVSRVMDTARGWTYSAGCEPQGNSCQHPTATTGSMTSVGIASIIICLSELTQREVNAAMWTKAETSVNDGLAWLSHNFTIEKNPGHPDGSWLYYYLYGLERAAVLANVRNMGQHDWYREGAEALMTMQDGKGCWFQKVTCGVLPASCLALLFLTKATVPVAVKITGH